MATFAFNTTLRCPVQFPTSNFHQQPYNGLRDPRPKADCPHSTSLFAPSPVQSNGPEFDDLPDLVDDPNSDDEEDDLPDLVSPPPSPASDRMDSSSTDPQTPASEFDPEMPFDVLDGVIGDDTLRTLIRVVLGAGATLTFAPHTTADIVPVVHLGRHYYRVRPILDYQYRQAFDRLCALFMCAVNNFNPWIHGWGRHIPIAVPVEALRELGIDMPGLCLFRGYTGRTFESRLFDKPEGVLTNLAVLQAAIKYNFLLVANGFEIAKKLGLDSVINWGAPLGLSKLEFHWRVGGRIYDGKHELAVYVAHKALRDHIDFACAHFIRRTADTLLITSRDERSYVAVWPLSEDQHIPVTKRQPADNIARMILAEQGIKMEELMHGIEKLTMGK
ncbi:hypothetical protein K438DRAFT_1996335 [Mycena galopus ATCC 62051]|nr:hypothetical protein K438DRAFT_1996335 [Mycena galopus ATCC 62051]